MKPIKLDNIDDDKARLYIDQLYAQDYIERPVDIIPFISDKHYLGKSTNNGDAVYPAWKKHLVNVFLDDSRTQIILSGAIGTGKTSNAVLIMAYCMYRVLLLKDPWGYFGGKAAMGAKMAVSFFNLTRNLSDSKAYNSLMNVLMESSWFQKKGRILGRENKYIDFPLFSYVLASPYSKGFGNVGENIITGIMDEVDSTTESDKQKVRVLKAYDSGVERFKSRFEVDGCSLGRFILSSSKGDEAAFLQTFVIERESDPDVYIVDMSRYEALPEGTFSATKFKVSVGNAYVDPKIIETPEEEEEARKAGIRIEEVPDNFLLAFRRDIIVALRDISGIAVKGERSKKWITYEKFITESYDENKQDPVNLIVIEVGLEDGLNDDYDFIHFMDLSKIRVPKEVPRYIHGDIAFTQDAFGLAMSCIRGFVEKDVERQDGTFVKEKVPVVETDFAMRIKAKKGQEIPLHKVRKFLLSLRARGFNIAKYTSDLKMASTDTEQILNRAGIKAEYFSVDKTEQPYLDFRNLIYEQRWVCHFNAYLHFELCCLEKKDGKFDHPDTVKDVQILKTGEIKEVALVGSKDMADAVCGSVVNALAFDKKDQPMDMAAMQGLFAKLNMNPDTVANNKYWWVSDKSGEKVVGVVGPGGSDASLNKFVDMLKKANL